MTTKEEERIEKVFQSSRSSHISWQCGCAQLPYGAMLCSETQNDFDFCLFPLSLPLTILFPSRSLFSVIFLFCVTQFSHSFSFNVAQRETRAKFLVFHLVFFIHNMLFYLRFEQLNLETLLTRVEFPSLRLFITLRTQFDMILLILLLFKFLLFRIQHASIQLLC